MLHIIRLTFAAFVIAAFLLINVSPPNVKINGCSPMGFDEGNEAMGFKSWEMARLADPATGKIPDNIRALELEFASKLPKNYSRSSNWELIGPRDLGGRTRAAQFDVLNDSIIIAGGVTGGLWKSTNAGASFYKTTAPAQLHSVTSIVQDTRAGHENTWYAGTGEYYPVTSASAYSARFSGNGIFKSTDNGETWNLLTSTISNTPQTNYAWRDFDYVWRMVIDHTNSSQDVVLAAVYNGVWRSTDGGTTWTSVLGLDTNLTTTSDYTDLIITPSGVFYAFLSSDSPNKGIYRSTDGVTWINILPSTGFPGTYNRFTMAYNPQNENEVLFVGNTPGSGQHDHSLFKYTYLSGNGSGTGGQWENRSTNLPDGSCLGCTGYDFGYFQTQSGYDVCIAFKPDDGNTVYLGGTNLYRSTDQFTSDTNITWIGGYQCDTINGYNYVYPNHHPDQHYLLFYPGNANKALSCNDGGLFYSDDMLASTVQWNSLNHHYITSQFYTVSLEEGEVATDYLAGGTQDNGTWYTNANHVDSLWKWVFKGDGSYVGIPEGRNYYVFSTQQGKMFKIGVAHNGDTTMATRFDNNQSSTSMFINPFILDPNNNDRLYAVQNRRITKHSNVAAIPLTGQTCDTINQYWSPLNQSSVAVSETAITCIEMSKAAPDVIYYGTYVGKAYKLTNANSSTQVKTTITPPGYTPNAYVSCIAANPFDGNEILLTYSNYKVPSIFHSKDGGATWQNVGGNLEENLDGSGNGPAIFWAAVYPSWPTPTYYVGTSVGLFSATSLDTNTVWVQEGPTTIGNVNINMIKARTYDGKIVVATHGNGIYSSYLTPTFIGMNENNVSPFYVSCYPNPATEFVNIDFTTPQRTDAMISVYDITGRMVYSEKLTAILPGKKQVRWNRENMNGTRVNAGTYLINVRMGDRTETKKVVVR